MGISVCSVSSAEKSDQNPPADQNFGLKESVSHGSAAFPASAYRENIREMGVAWHWHEELEIGWITCGEVVVSAGSVRKVLQEGQGFFINANLIHAMQCAGPQVPAELCSVVFHPSIVAGAAGSIFDEKYVQPVLRNMTLRYAFLEKEDKTILPYIKSAWKSISDGKKDYEIFFRSNLSMVLSGLSEHNGNAVMGQDTERVLRVQMMLEIIHQKFGEHLSLDQIAGEASISVSEALRCFRQVIGMTPGQYLKKYRLDRAAQMLRETKKPIADIGSLCGFQDGSYFSKSFREAYQQTPAQYRREKGIRSSV